MRVADDTLEGISECEWVNPYAAGGWFGQYKMMQKIGNWLKLWDTGTHLRVLSKSYPMNTKMKGV